MKRIIQLTLIASLFVQLGYAQQFREDVFENIASRLRIAEKEADLYIGKPFSKLIKHLEKNGLEVVLANAIEKMDSLTLTDRRAEGVFLRFTERLFSPIMPAMWVYFSNNLPYLKALSLFRKHSGSFTEEVRSFYADAIIKQIDIWIPKRVYDVVCGGIPDLEPEFPGGRAAMKLYLQRNIKDPRNELQMEVEEEIIVEFVIDKDGSVVNVEVVQGTTPDLMNEAKRTVSIMPRWIPGLDDFEPFRVKFTLPIIFRIEYFTSYLTGQGELTKIDFGELESTRLTPSFSPIERRERSDSRRRAFYEHIRKREIEESYRQ